MTRGLQMTTSCPYCDLASKNGDLFCSRHSQRMEGLQSGVFFIRAKKFEECDWHITRLSLNFNLDSRQPYWAGNREHYVSPEKYLLINEGQSFKTSADSEVDQRMVTIAFRSGLPGEMFNALTRDDHLLDFGTDDNSHPLFFEQTYPVDAQLRSTVLSLIEDGQGDDEQLQDQLEKVLLRVMVAQKDIQRRIHGIRKVKNSTKIEIFRRLHWAMDYLQDHYAENLTVDRLARHACLSPFHFKRLFREFYNEPPYQYIRKLRLKKAADLLLRGLPVNEVCRSVGWQDPSSFIRLFKKEMKVTPRAFRG